MTTSGCMLGQKRGTSSTDATMSRASRPAAVIPPRASIASSSATSVRTVGGANAPAMRSFIESFLDIGDLERLEQRLDLAIQHTRQVVQRESHAMVGDAILREIV